jgi:SIT family siderophore-iron:H+ symporter-like MFS transporter
MFTILTPALSFPIIMTLYYGQHKAKVEGKLDKIPLFFKGRKTSVITLELFWQLDFIGLILLVVGAGLILLTVTIANGLGSSWNSGM